METVLYRKYRPKNFKEVLGQDHIVKILAESVKLGHLAHAYLFAGSRGTGKTSVARILAETAGVSKNDIYEMDAASNRGIDDVRAIRDGVSTAPFESKYKVYIVDEAHMLTKDAFNALLKTLEEPPAHVIFILATTEMEKLPETVVSRCQVFKFKKPSQIALKEMTISVAKKEGFTLEPAAAELIALLGDGSFRDALGMLQKIIGASSDKKITATEVAVAAGAPRTELINEVITALNESEAGKGIEALRRAGEENIDMKIFLKLLLAKLRFVLLLRHAPEMKTAIAEEVSENDFAFLQKIATAKESRISAGTILEFLKAEEFLGAAAAPSLPLELAIIKLCT
ncbi:MAG: DNA polymerase III subunit gamma/tau [Candidatus Paceibacterota bacterium]|jgi:DNA polymerase-3 subunit gamma/tau